MRLNGFIHLKTQEPIFRSKNSQIKDNCYFKQQLKSKVKCKIYPKLTPITPTTILGVPSSLPLWHHWFYFSSCGFRSQASSHPKGQP